MKKYIITLSKTFPVSHPKKGQATGFRDKFTTRKKKHTIRGNYALWKKRIDEVNAGIAKLYVREWSGKPYASPQVDIEVLSKVGIQSIELEFCEVNNQISSTVKIDDEYPSLELFETLVENEGLCLVDFIEWFKKPLTNGCIISFTDLRY